MSTDTTTGDCPRCGARNGLTHVSDTQFPWPEHYGYCLECGFRYDTSEGVRSPREVNAMRIEQGLPALDRLAQPLPGWEYV
jgi:hypothetical protein